MKLVNQQINKNQFTEIYKIISVNENIYDIFIYEELKLSKEEIKSMMIKNQKCIVRHRDIKPKHWLVKEISGKWWQLSRRRSAQKLPSW